MGRANWRRDDLQHMVNVEREISIYFLCLFNVLAGNVCLVAEAAAVKELNLCEFDV